VNRVGSRCDVRIEQHDSSLARQLRDSVRTGGACRYDPDPDRSVRCILGGDAGAARHAGFTLRWVMPPPTPPHTMIVTECTAWRAGLWEARLG
jgi:hypothetical protein